MKKTIQRVELTKYYDVSIFCPFCGENVLNYKAAHQGEEYLKPCKHTLFVAHDEGFEYRSEIFNDNLNLPKKDDDIELDEEGYDGLTDKVNIDDSIKFASYIGPPSGMGTYIGFRPFYEDED